MNSDEPIPQANMRLQAAQSILDRIGLSKTDRNYQNIIKLGLLLKNLILK